jgi:plastocyanin
MTKKIKILFSIVAVASLALTYACGNQTPGTGSSTPAPAPTPASTPQQVAVSIPQGAVGQGTAAYGTNPLVVNVGSTVTWTNNDTVDHDVASDTGVFDSGNLSPGQTFSYTFPTAGTYPYFDSIYGEASMSGAVQVGPSPSPSVSPSPSASPSSSPTPSPTPSVSPSPSPSASPFVSPVTTQTR